MQETKSNWAIVNEEMGTPPPVSLGRYASYWFHKTPRRVLHSMSYYKFAAKLIGKNKRVLDVGCNEGLGTFVIGKECGFAKGIDFDSEAIATASSNFKESFVQFEAEDFLKPKEESKFDAVINFDVIEHIYPEHAGIFFQSIKASLNPHGIAIVGTPSLISQNFASEISKKGHVNVYDPARLYKEMSEHFDYVFLFAANDELIHTGYLPLAHYLIAVGCEKRDRAKY